MPRTDSFFQINRMKLNEALREKCTSNGFIFIENDHNIILKYHVSSDEVHLTKQGGNLLKRNLLEALNS